MPYKPDGYTSVAPYLIVDDAMARAAMEGPPSSSGGAGMPSAETCVPVQQRGKPFANGYRICPGRLTRLP